VKNRLVPHSLGLQNREPGSERARLDRRVGELVPAAARSIGLRHHPDNRGRRSAKQRIERGNGKGRRAEEHDPETFHHFPARVSL
jgi:hypothetical protein